MKEESFNLKGNPELKCVKVDNIAYAEANWLNVDSKVSFTEDEDCITTIDPDTDPVLGIGDHTNSPKVIILPNPTAESFEITGLDKIPQVVVYSSTGSMVLSKRSNLINVANLLPGVYLVRIQQSQQVYTRKLVKY